MAACPQVAIVLQKVCKNCIQMNDHVLFCPKNNCHVFRHENKSEMLLNTLHIELKHRRSLQFRIEHSEKKLQRYTYIFRVLKTFLEFGFQFIKKSDLMLEKVCAEDGASVKTVEELTSTKKELDDLVNSMSEFLSKSVHYYENLTFT